MENIERKVRTRFHLGLVSSVWLRSIEDNIEIMFYLNCVSPWFNKKSKEKKMVGTTGKASLGD